MRVRDVAGAQCVPLRYEAIGMDGMTGLPDIGAYYYEDAAAALEQAGVRVGRVELTAPPRREKRGAETAAAPGADGQARGGGAQERYGYLADLVETGADGTVAGEIPPKKYRVVKYGLMEPAASAETAAAPTQAAAQNPAAYVIVAASREMPEFNAIKDCSDL